MTKVSSSISVDDWKLERLRAMKISVTRIVEKAIDSVISGEMEDVAVSAQIGLLDDEISSLEQRIFTLEHQLDFSRKRLVGLKQRRLSVESEWEEVKRSSYLAGKLRRLNFIIIGAGYHMPTIKERSEEIVAEIKSIHEEFELEAHVARIRALMES